MPKLFKNQHLTAFVILLGMLTVAFSNILFLGKTLTSSSLTVGTTRLGPYEQVQRPTVYPVADGAASAWQFEPAMQLNNQAYLSGHLPLWNPYNGAGQPLAADMQSSSFYPLAIPLILNPSPFMWDLFLILRLLVAGFLTYLFLRQIDIGFRGSIIGAITFMLSGYLIFFVNMAHLNVEILIPLTLLTTELLIKKRGILSAFLLAISATLSILGGMPESTVLLIVFTIFYFLFRLVKERQTGAKNNELLSLSFYFGLSMTIGLGISAVSWAAFLEYFKLFWSKHGDGSISGTVALPLSNILQYLAPMSIGVHDSAYVGVLPLFLSIVGKKKHAFKWFFITAALLFAVKIFGLDFGILGKVPVLSQILVYKYGQPFLAFSVAVLFAFVCQNNFKANYKLAAGVFVGWISALLFFRSNALTLLDFTTKGMRYDPLSVRIAFLFLLISVAIVAAAKLINKKKLDYLAIFAILLVFIELWAHIPGQRPKRVNPYQPPSFVKFLQKQKRIFRTYAVSSVLHPNTNAAYKISDIRSLNAMQPKNYLNYLSNFSPTPEPNHITGLEGANIGSKYFDALNIGYVLALEPLETNLRKQLQLQKSKKFLDKKDKTIIWIMPPYKADFSLPKDVKYLNFTSKSDEKTSLIIQAARQKFYFKETIKRGITKHKINISSLAGKKIRFKFDSKDVLLTSFHYTSDKSLDIKFKKVFSEKLGNYNVVIYKNKDVMNRVNVYDNYVYSKKDTFPKNFDIRKSALVQTPIKSGKGNLVYNAKISLYEPQRVSIDVKTNKAALLVLADTYYPGWKAYVDGKPAKVIKANQLFRGVFIAPNTKKVEFYYQPDSYKTGFSLAAISLFAVPALFGSAIFFKRKTSKHIANENS